MKKNVLFKDRYGFWFWLRWIVWFAGSFIVSAVFWTMLMKNFFHEITGPELQVTWAVSVFGSWFLLVIPFMRKKEQIWKRLNQDQERAVTISFQGAGIFIGLWIAACFFWSFSMRPAIRNYGLDREWTKNVFITWLVLLIPFLIWMYRRADAIFRRAHARQTYAPRHKSIYIDLKGRRLPKNIAEKLKDIPETLPGAHLVHVTLKNGDKVPHVFIKFRREIAGIYGREELGFEAAEITEIRGIDPKEFPAYEESKWLRLDGPDRDLHGQN